MTRTQDAGPSIGAAAGEDDVKNACGRRLLVQSTLCASVESGGRSSVSTRGVPFVDARRQVFGRASGCVLLGGQQRFSSRCLGRICRRHREQQVISCTSRVRTTGVHERTAACKRNVRERAQKAQQSNLPPTPQYIHWGWAAPGSRCPAYVT